MIDPEPVPRPGLMTNGDFDAWAEQFLLLAYTLRMTPMQIAQIDYGLDPEHSDAWAVASWAQSIRTEHPLVDARAMIERARRA